MIFHVGSHLGAGFDASLEQVVAALGQILDGYDGEHLARDGELGRPRRHDRPLDRRARHARRRARPPSRASASASTRATSSPPATTSRDRAAVDALVAEVDETIGLDRLCALHVNDSATPLGSNRDRHANILEGEIGEGLGAFLAHPAFQELGAYLEVPGAGDGAGRERARRSCAAPRTLDVEDAAGCRNA